MTGPAHTPPESYAHSAQTPNYARYAVEFVRGEGVWLFDRAGERYLDLLSGLGVNNVGHCHPAVVEAVERQSRQLIHASNLFWTEPAELLAARLSELSLGGKVFLCNSGAEANEAAIKLARARKWQAGSPARNVVVVERAFHGRTMGALSATPQEDKQAPFAPLVGGFAAVPRDDVAALAAVVDDRTCAVLIEPVQGEGGVHVFSDEFLVAARDACDRVDALLVFDEVQCGVGRTGRLWAHEHTPVRPDVMTLAKGLAGGLPIGAVVTAPHCSDALQPGFHGSTFGGNPVVAGAAGAVLDVVADDAFLTRTRAAGARLADLLASHGRVAGRGLMLGVELPAGVDAREVVSRLLYDRRVIVNATDEHTLRLLPPLVIGDAEIDAAAAAIDAALAA
jgi:predicted acetylornithine/succinylornithine family transaminase